MTFRARFMMLAAIWLQTLLAASDVDADWTTTAFVACMQKTCPEYPDGICQQGIVMSCHNQSISQSTKRDSIEISSFIDHVIRARDLPSFSTDPKPTCDQQTLPKNFLVVSDIRSNAQSYCQTMKTDLLAKGAGYISQNLSSAVTKTGDELHGNKAVLLSLVLGAYPPASAGFKTIQGVDTLVVNACAAALTTLATKGSGCTADINWYDAGKWTSETSTGALPGTINIASQGVDWLMLTAQYLKPSPNA